MRQVPQMLYALRLGLHYVKGCICSTDGGRSSARAEDIRTCVVTYIIGYIVVAGYETAQRSERLAEGRHDQVDVVSDTFCIAKALTLRAEDTHAVGLVDHDGRFVFLCQLNHLLQRSEVAFHAEDTIHNNEFEFVRPAAAEHLLEMVHVVVLELEYGRHTQAPSLDDGSMVPFVDKKVILPACEA